MASADVMIPKADNTMTKYIASTGWCLDASGWLYTEWVATKTARRAIVAEV